MVPTDMLQLMLTIWIHGVLIGVIAEGPFSASGHYCTDRGHAIAKTLIKHRYPRYKGKVKIEWECSEQLTRIT